MANAPNAAAWSNMQNALLTYAKIRESQASGESLRATRESQRIKDEQETRKYLQTQQEENLRRRAEGVFGTKYEPEMEPALAGARTMQVEPRLFNPKVPNVPAPVLGTTGTAAPGGMPSLIARTPTSQDIEASMRSGGAQVRDTTVQRGRALGLPEGHPLLQEFATSQQLILPGQAQDIITKSAQGRQEQVKAEVAETTKPDEIAKLRALSAQEVSKAAKSELELQKERSAAPYYEVNAYNDAKIKQNEAAIKQFEVSQQPEKAERLRLENEQLRGNIEKNDQDIRMNNHVFGLMDAYHKTNDPAVKTKIFRDIAVARGQTPQLLAHDLQTQEASLKASSEAIRQRATGQADFAAGRYEEGMAAYDVANRHEIQSAKLSGSDTVQLMIPQRNKSWWRGETAPTIGRTKTPTARAEMYIDGRIDAIATGARVPTGQMVRLEPGLTPEPEFYDQADALAWKAYYDNLPVATDMKEITKIIGGYNAPQDVKERALLKYQSLVRESEQQVEVTPSTRTAPQQLGLRGMTPEERSVPRNWAGLPSQPTRGFLSPSATPPASGAQPQGLPPGAQFKPASPEANRQQFTPIIDAAADKYNIPREIFHRLVKTESNYNPYAKGKKGEVGLVQLMPATAAELKVDPTNPRQNVEGGARYLRQLLDQYGGDMRKALIAYNWGMGRMATGAAPPPETEAYVAAIMR